MLSGAPACKACAVKKGPADDVNVVVSSTSGNPLKPTMFAALLVEIAWLWNTGRSKRTVFGKLTKD